MTVYDFLKKVQDDTMVSFRTKKYGFIWAGKRMFASSAFMPSFYDREVTSSSTDKYGNISIEIQ